MVSQTTIKPLHQNKACYYISVIGYYPNLIGFPSPDNDKKNIIIHEIINFLKNMKKKFEDTHEVVIISRLDVLFDLDVVAILNDLQISYIIALPAQNIAVALEKSTTEISIQNAIKNSKEIVHLGLGYSKESMMNRDEWMIEKSDMIFAVYNGDENTLTSHAIEYCSKLRKPIVMINPNK
jgi:uncharacterized phage-like protein YoqJ